MDPGEQPGPLDYGTTSEVRAQFYTDLENEVAALLDRAWFTNLANTCASVFMNLPNLNWAGFYLFAEGELILGPFQGRPACLRIGMGKGVCGTAAREKKSIVVEDVEHFPGHIACDSRSKSEIVIPMLHQGRLIGVLDLDSPQLGRFNEDDRLGLEKVVRKLTAGTDWPAKFL